MKKLLFVLLFAPTIAAAQGLPSGCYGTYADNPWMYCYNGTTTPNYTLNYSDWAYYYGYQMADRMLEAEGYLVRALSCEQDLNINATSLNSCNSAYNAMTANRDAWYNSYNSTAASLSKANSLVKKLRKACGSKCKKIK